MAVFATTALNGSGLISSAPSINQLRSSRQSFACSTAVCLSQWKSQIHSQSSSSKSLETEKKRTGVRCAASSESKVGFFGKLGRVIKEKAKGDIDRLFNGFSKTRQNLSVVDELLTYWNLPDSENTLDELEEVRPVTADEISSNSRADQFCSLLTNQKPENVEDAKGIEFLIWMYEPQFVHFEIKCCGRWY